MGLWVREDVPVKPVITVSYCLVTTVKPDLSGHSKEDQKLVFMTDDGLMLQESILQYFRPSLSYHLVFKICVLSIFEWSLKTGLAVFCIHTLTHYTPCKSS